MDDESERRCQMAGFSLPQWKTSCGDIVGQVVAGESRWLQVRAKGAYGPFEFSQTYADLLILIEAVTDRLVLGQRDRKSVV